MIFLHNYGAHDSSLYWIRMEGFVREQVEIYMSIFSLPDKAGFTKKDK